ncbi:MAG: xanthine dehydrogenase family protein subunit M [Bacteroidota bacterium]
MIPEKFTYHRASSVSEALQMMGAHDDAKILAGGHSLLPAMKLRLNAPGNLIDISRIAELRYVRDGGDHIAIGAGATHYDIESSALVQAEMPMMSQAAGLIGDPAVRNMGTIGGSIAHADPAADWPASLLAANASVVMQSAGGSRTVTAGDFFQGFYATALEDGELITEIRVPKAPGMSSAYAKFMQPASRFAIVGCAAMLRMEGGNFGEVRIGFTGVGDVPFRDAGIEGALAGQAANAENIAAACAQAAAGRDILSDHFASEKYRKHLAGVYAKRAIMAAMG